MRYFRVDYFRSLFLTEKSFYAFKKRIFLSQSKRFLYRRLKDLFVSNRSFSLYALSTKKVVVASG